MEKNFFFVSRYGLNFIYIMYLSCLFLTIHINSPLVLFDIGIKVTFNIKCHVMSDI